MGYTLDMSQHEPPPEEDIQALVEFSSAIIEQAEMDDCLYEMATSWPREKVVAYQMAFEMFNASMRIIDAIRQDGPPPDDGDPFLDYDI